MILRTIIKFNIFLHTIALRGSARDRQIKSSQMYSDDWFAKFNARQSFPLYGKYMYMYMYVWNCHAHSWHPGFIWDLVSSERGVSPAYILKGLLFEQIQYSVIHFVFSFCLVPFFTEAMLAVSQPAFSATVLINFWVPPPSTHQARTLNDAALATRIKELAEKDQYFLVSNLNLFLWGFVTHELSPSLPPSLPFSLPPSLPPPTYMYPSLAKKLQKCVCRAGGVEDG